MPNSKFFGIPFATSGDKVTIPEAVQPSGAMSFTQGFGPDYERNPATDPLAKRVPRDETNEIYYQITNVLRWLQLYGLPEWYAVDSLGAPVSYPIAARVRHLDQAWVSLVATNTATPGADATKWGVDGAFDLPTLEATLAEALAGALGTKLITPRRLASSVQRGAWNWGVQGGTASAATLTLSPAPLAYSAGQIYQFVVTQSLATNATLNVNGLGAIGIRRLDNSTIPVGDIRAGDTVTILYNGVQHILIGFSRSQASQAALLPQTTVSFTTPGTTTFTVPPGVNAISLRLWGAGGGGGYAATNPNRTGAPSGGSSGAYAERRFPVSPGDVVSVTVGTGGLGGSVSPAQPGQPGTASSVTVNGVTVTAGGGPGGLNVTTATTANAPGRATTSNADFSIDGSNGLIGFSTTGVTTGAGGYGAPAPLGGGAVPGGAGGNQAGAVPGGGGGSSSDYLSAGGAGARGQVLLSYVAI